MATIFGVQPEGFLTVHKGTKRPAVTSPPQKISKWNGKKNKSASPPAREMTQSQIMMTESETVANEMVLHLSLAVGKAQEDASREVVDPHKPPKSS